MYDIRAEYLLLFINNPGCNMCKTVREAISASPMLNELIERGKLKVLALFPDEDLTEWQNTVRRFPRAGSMPTTRGASSAIGSFTT